METLVDARIIQFCVATKADLKARLVYVLALKLPNRDGGFSMTMLRKVQLLAVAAAAAVSGFASTARADDERTFAYSFNLGGFSDYRFRGISQTGGDPAIQGGVDMSYGIGYFGVWASNLDFGTIGGKDVANAEVDIYGGIKPVLGPVTFDLGVIYYAYPKARDGAGGTGLELDYVEFKAGASMSPITNLTTGVTFYYSPENTGETGNVYTIEGTAGYTLPKFWVFDPSISGRLGYQHGNDVAFQAITNGDDSYMYWDAGLTLTVEKIAFDFRYVDTDISSAGGFCDGTANGGILQCDSTFVASVKITLP